MNTSNLRLTVLLVFAMISTLSCQNNSGKKNTPEIRDNAAEEIAEDMETPLPALPYVAIFDEQTEQLKAEKNADFDATSMRIETLTQALTANYPEITPEIDRVSNDTLYLHITNAQFLTQQMGSSGARTYLMEATYAYTELPNIHVVHFSFTEGDHAIPGDYTREYFSRKQ